MNIRNGKKMSNEEKKKLILDFINGPLYTYLQGEISFGRFKELINEKFGTDFTYGDLYPSYLFNAQLSYEDHHRNMIEEFSIIEYEKKITACHAYGLCASGYPYNFPCSKCPLRNK